MKTDQAGVKEFSDPKKRGHVYAFVFFADDSGSVPKLETGVFPTHEQFEAFKKDALKAIANGKGEGA